MVHPAAARAPVVMVTLTLVNAYTFGRFNPIQPASSIFQLPDSEALRALKAEAAASPDGVLVKPGDIGAVLNGLGFRSVSHAQLAPNLKIFRRYFPEMDPQQFNTLFNRHAYISLSQTPMPVLASQISIELPMDPFLPVRNVRRVMFGPPREKACSGSPAGAIKEVSAQGATLTVEGWAPWIGETDEQGIRILAARPLRTDSLSTITRPDVVEQLWTYNFLKSGFKLRISSVDGKPLRPQDVTLFAFGTLRGDIRLPCCACP